MSVLRFLLRCCAILVLFIPCQLYADEFTELNARYETLVTETGKMTGAANELREEIIGLLFDDKLFSKAVPFLRDTHAWYEQEGVGGRDMARLRLKLGKALQLSGYYDEARPILKSACERSIDNKGEQHQATITKCVFYGMNLSIRGRHDNAITLLKKNLDYAENTFGDEHGKTGWVHMQLGSAQYRTGEQALALKNLKAAYDIFDLRKGSDSRITNIARLKLAQLFAQMGRLDKSELILRKAYTEFAVKTENQQHPLSSHLMTQLGRTLMMQGRFIEAEQLLKEAVSIKTEILGAASHKTVFTMLTLAEIYLEQQLYPEAWKVLQAINKAGDELDDRTRIGSRRNLILARTLLNLGKLEQAQASYARVKHYVDTLSGATVQMLSYQQGLGRVLYRKKMYAKAEPYLLEATRLSAKIHGEHNPNTALVKSYLAANYAGQKNFSKAVAVYREVMDSNAGFLANRKTLSAKGRSQQEAAAQRYLISYMDLMIDAYVNGVDAGIDPISESFVIAENSRSKSLQAAMLGQTARAAARNEYLTDLVRREQDLRVQLGLLEEQLLEFVSNVRNGDNKQGKQLERRRRELYKELRGINEEMNHQYPEYARLLNPGAVKLQALQEKLLEGELLLAYFVQKERTLIWFIDRDKATFHVSSLAEKDIRDRVKKLRASLDVPVTTLADIPDYDTKLAHELFSELIAPAGKQLENARNLIFVPHRSLLSMPFGALVTANSKPAKTDTPFVEYKNVPWLAKKYAISIIPSATTLVAMRTYVNRENAEEPFIGFGDPVFNARDDSLDAEGTGETVMRGASIVQRSVVNTNSLKELPNLPETRIELKKIALTLGVGEENIYLGRKASEPNVRNTGLKQYRVIAFATHGLVAGDLDGLNQPALALTPPEKSSAEDDGLLQMGEVLGLEMNADWVVLSACNTASGDESYAGEGLTGLTQAFFYAGSRALLVSLWPVESNSTQLLTTTLFKAAQANKQLTRAASLQVARKRLIEGEGYIHNGKQLFSYAHPIFWSAFIAVGEGGK